MCMKISNFECSASSGVLNYRVLAMKIFATTSARLTGHEYENACARMTDLAIQVIALLNLLGISHQHNTPVQKSEHK